MKPVLEHISEDKDQSFYLGRYEQKSFNFPWHYHPQWELTFIVEGSGTAYAANTTRHFVSGELALIAPHVPHCWKSNPGAARGVKSLFIQWDEHFLGEQWLHKNEFRAIKELLEKSKTGFIFERSTAQQMGEKLLQLAQQSPFERLITFLNVLQILAHSASQPISHGEIYYKNQLASKRIETILNFITDHYQEKISADEMAQTTNMTPVSFSKYFKKTFNKPFTVYLSEYRISQACDLLIHSDESIEEIAHLSGFQNMSLFHRQFKKVMVQTPLKYRQNFRNIDR